MGQRWEYQIVVVRWAASDLDDRATERQLNALGAEGWELVFVGPTGALEGAPYRIKVVLKRPVA